MKFINDKSTGFKSLAVILPTIATIIYAVGNFWMDSNLIPIEYLPFVIPALSFLGRIIEQPNIKE